MQRTASVFQNHRSDLWFLHSDACHAEILVEVVTTESDTKSHNGIGATVTAAGGYKFHEPLICATMTAQ